MSETDVSAIAALMGSLSVGSSALPRADACSACGSVCSASDYKQSINSFLLDALYVTAGCERPQTVSAGSYWEHSLAGAARPIEPPDVSCQATVFFTSGNSAAVAVGCPCKSCVKAISSMGKPPVDAQQPVQPWEYQRPEQRESGLFACYTQPYGGRSRATSDDAWTGDVTNPAAAVASPEDAETLRTLIYRAKQGFTATGAAGAASRRSEPAPVQQQALRRTAPGGILRPASANLPAPHASRRRTEARSTSPIPVPSPLPGVRVSAGTHPQRRRAPPLTAPAAAQSVDEDLLRDGGRGKEHAEAGDVVRIEDLRHDQMLKAIMRMYGDMRQERARRPPGRPSEPLTVVVGFEPKGWPRPVGGGASDGHVLIP